MAETNGPDEMRTLPDLLGPGLALVFVGLNPSEYSAREGHYFANPRNRFWDAFNSSALLPPALGRECSPPDDAALLEHGIGFTDVVKRPTPQANALKAADFRLWAPPAAREAAAMPTPAGLLSWSDGLQGHTCAMPKAIKPPRSWARNPAPLGSRAYSSSPTPARPTPATPSRRWRRGTMSWPPRCGVSAKFTSLEVWKRPQRRR